ncbi:MAG: acetyltransferase [Paramuribaculum sp.]|nr:acetyltransferase [Paramuribaculum sp.]
MTPQDKKNAPDQSPMKSLPLWQRMAYWPLLLTMKGLARMPLGALYPLSDGLAWILRNIVGYRVKTVRENLAACYPDLSQKELKKIEKQFYLQFTDYFFETIKLLHISDEEIKRRMVFDNIELIDSLFDRGKSIVTYFSHTGNWEWAPSVTLWSRYALNNEADFCQVYRPLKNKWFDALFLHLRSRFHPRSFPKHTVFRDLLLLKRDKRLSITGFMSDQKPSHGDPTHVMMFLNRPTAMITGTETVCRRLDMAAIYWDMQKTSRGHYRINVKLLSDDVTKLPPMALTEMYAASLQKTINANPSLWLWSHKRWKIPVTLPQKTDHNEQSIDSSNNPQLER